MRTRNKFVVRGVVGAAALVVLGFALRSIFAKPSPAVDSTLASASGAPELDPVTKLRNGLLWVRVPSGYRVTALDNSTIEIDDDDLSLTLGAVAHPYTHDAALLGRQMSKKLVAKLGAQGVTAGERVESPATCLGKYPGTKAEEPLSGEGFRPSHLRGCYFVHDDVVVLVSWILPDAEAKEEQRAVDRIFASVELHDAVVPNWDEQVKTALPNGLLVAHHPSFYVAKITDDATASLHGPDRTDVTFSARALAGDPSAIEAGWWTEVAAPHDGMTYRETSRAPATCFGGHRGTGAVGVAGLGDAPAFEVHSCFFVSGSHAYATSYQFPVGQAEAEKALVRIVESMEITAP